ncbi:hypothetical protein HNR74_002477 [Flammeovirga kamogawensis]|nr:hypothetical protein [Flammeovirga kamogawensis]
MLGLKTLVGVYILIELNVVLCKKKTDDEFNIRR